MSTKKLIIKIAILLSLYFLVAIFVLAPYLSSYVFIKTLNPYLIAKIPFSVSSYAEFIVAFMQNKPVNMIHEKAIKFGLLGFFAPIAFPFIVGLLTGLIILIKRPKKSIHGDDRLANDRDLAKSKFFKEKSNEQTLIIGKIFEGRFKDQYIKYSGQQFLMLYAPTRSGKGVGIVIPNCLYYSDSIVVLDIKLENFELTAGHRKDNLGQEVILFCPDGYNLKKDGEDIKRSHRYNPLFYIDRDFVERTTDLNKISSILFPKNGGENDVWIDLAESIFNGLALYLLDIESEVDEKKQPKIPVTLANILSLSAPSDGKNLGDWIKSEIKERNSEKNEAAWAKYLSSKNPSDKPELNKLDEATVKLLYQFANKPIKQQENILMSFQAELKVFNDPRTAAATNGNDFDLRDVKKKKMSIYYGLSPDGTAMYKRLTNLFFSQLVGLNVGKGMLPASNPELKYQCLLVLDEFTSMGRVGIIQESVAYTASYNLRYMFILQNKGQLEDKDAYGKEGAETLISNCAVELFYPPRSVDDSVKNVSETIGYYDYTTKTKTKTRAKGGSSTTYGEQVNKRAVMLPNEIVDLRQHKDEGSDIALREIILSEFCYPIVANKIIYFKEPYFLERKEYSENNIPEIPILKIDKNEMMDFIINHKVEDKEIKA